LLFKQHTTGLTDIRMYSEMLTEKKQMFFYLIYKSESIIVLQSVYSLTEMHQALVTTQDI